MTHTRTGWMLAAWLLCFGCPHGVGSNVQVVALHHRLEFTTHAPGAQAVRARVSTPAGLQLELGAFSRGEGRWTFRFSPAELGRHRFELFAVGAAGPRPLMRGAFDAVPSTRKGPVRVHPRNPRLLGFADGTVFHPLGENRFNVYDPSWNHAELPPAEYVAAMGRGGMNTLRVFVRSDCEDEARPGQTALGCLEPELGVFDESVAAQYDRIFEAAEQHGVYVVFTLFAVGFTPGDVWKGWEDNPYARARGGPAESPEAFFTSEDARAAAKRRLEYVLARYSSFHSFLMLDLLNEPEWDGNIAEQTWLPWAVDLARTWRAGDPYGHPVTLGSVGLHWNVGGDERAWWATPEDDVVQWHLYGKEVYAVHALARELRRKTQEVWHFEKPVLVGEFGYGGEDPVTHDHTHVGIWSATFSGAGVLAHSAPPFTVDSDAPMPPSRRAHFGALARFLRAAGERALLLPCEPPAPSLEGTFTACLGEDRPQALWALAPEKDYGQPVANLTLKARLPPGAYRVEWWNDVSGEPFASAHTVSTGDAVVLQVPPFIRHVAARVERL